MLKVNQITFKGIEQAPQVKDVETTAAPITKELGAAALPVGDKSMAISPALPSEFLGETDLARYKKVQRAFAESMAAKLDIPVENVMARLSDVKLGDAKKMLSVGIAGFNGEHNTIEITPIREIVNSFGGDEATIAHESTHSYLHNLRRAYAKQHPDNILYDCSNFVFHKMQNGEHGRVISEFNPVEVNAQMTLLPTMITAPPLSKRERVALAKAINSVYSQDGLFNERGLLNEQGQEFVKKNLVPKLEKFTKLFEKDGEDKTAKKMVDYINSFNPRRSLLFNILTTQSTDLPKNFQTSLSPKEIKLAKESLLGLLSTQEGNYAQQLDFLGIGSDVTKAYFTSYEELLARKQENLYRLQQVMQKIGAIKAQGLVPAETLLKEQQMAERNLRLLKLVKQLNSVEQKMISASKDPERLRIIVNSPNAGDIIPTTENQAGLAKLRHMMQEGQAATQVVKQLESNADASEALKHQEKIIRYIVAYHSTNQPEQLMADTVQNRKLRRHFDVLMGKIKELAKECDLDSVPAKFFGADGDCREVAGKASAIMQKWARRLAESK